ncbi:MAG: TIGR02453 family protein [Terriglobia bacterium]|nr:MAG: TIGR02453 family protein [Terriglobia bacterium]
MRAGFPGFPEEGIQFFRALAKNNKRDWFQPRKHIYEQQVKQPMRDLVAAVNAAMTDFAPGHVTDPDKAIYRIYRDTRFSKDKTPYKDHIAAHFPWRWSGRHDGAGYYFAISHKEVAVGGGVYMPTPEILLALRNHIASQHAQLRKLTAVPAVRKLLGELQGDRLSRVPKGFAADHPAADLLRLKYFVLYVVLPPELATTKALFREIVKRFQAMAPVIDFLNTPLAPAKKKIDARELLL